MKARKPVAKRVEAWAAVQNGEICNMFVEAPRKRGDTKAWTPHSWTPMDEDTVVHLVEANPRAAAVVKAAVKMEQLRLKWVEEGSHPSDTHRAAWIDAILVLERAVERLAEGKR